MNKNFALPISGPTAIDNCRFKSLQYTPFFEIDRNTKIKTEHWVNWGRIVNFCLRFSIFLFATLLLFTVFNNQNQSDCLSGHQSELATNKSDTDRQGQELNEQQASDLHLSNRQFFASKDIMASRRHRRSYKSSS